MQKHVCIIFVFLGDMEHRWNGMGRLLYCIFMEFWEAVDIRYIRF